MVKSVFTFKSMYAVMMVLNFSLLLLLGGYVLNHFNKKQCKSLNYGTTKQQHVQQNIQPQVVRINQATQGDTHYMQIGILHNANNVIIPLMGKPTHRRSHMWNYYTLTSQALSIRIPLENEGRSCDSAYGCKELFDGEMVFIPEYQTKFTVKLYDRSPKYIPII